MRFFICVLKYHKYFKQFVDQEALKEPVADVHKDEEMEAEEEEEELGESDKEKQLYCFKI